MRPASAKLWLRTALAVVFAFMSLAHQPVMTFARANAMVVHHDAVADTTAHHQHQHQHKQSLPLPAEHESVCNAVGCFALAPPPAIIAPAAELRPFATLAPASARDLIATIPEPADPPPRLQT